MGSLAIWGGLGGLGKGEVENAEAQRKVQAAQMEADRQMALAKYAQTNENERQSKQLASDEARTAQEVQGRTANVATEQAGAKERTGMEIGERASANQGRSQAMIEIAKIRAAALKEAADKRASGKSGWSQKVLKQSGFDPQSHLPTENDVVAVTHPAYGTFVQNGDKFVPQGTPSASLKRAPISEVNDVLANPDHADAFLSVRGYLPAAYFKVLANKGQLSMSDQDAPALNANPDNDPVLQGLTPDQIKWAEQPAE